MGGHLDTTFRGWSSTLAARVRLVISRLLLIFVLPLDFHVRVRVVLSMYLPAALHGIEASLLASESLRKLRSAIRSVVWSRRQPLASVDMKDWVLSQEGDQWSVRFDVRDLGGHLDTTFRGWSATLAARVRLVIARLVLIFVLPLDFHGRVRVVRSMFLPAALHGIEASLLASDSLLKLRSSICRMVWSRRQPLANVGAVLSMLDGPFGCDPLFCVVWFRFRLFRRFLALRPSQVGRAYRLLDMVSEGCPGHGPVHLLVASAAEIGFRWDPLALAWSRPGLPLLSNLAGPIQHFRSAILDAWQNKAAADLCGREVFGVAPCWTFVALCSFLTLLMYGTVIRVCFVVF